VPAVWGTPTISPDDAARASTSGVEDVSDARRKPGRPHKLTNDVRDLICGAIAAGLTMEQAAQAAGVGHTSLLARDRAAHRGEDIRYVQ
jgi:hypothetical protein